MTSLPDGWAWYLSARRQLSLMQRLARRHWDRLPWDGPLGRDDEFVALDAGDVERETRTALDHLDDLAVVVLFSVFEAEVRGFVLEPFDAEVAGLRQPILRAAAADARDGIERGSFARVMNPFKRPEWNDLIEQVNQVREYRNWVSHGRRGEPAALVTPKQAYDRLTQFLDAIRPPGDPPNRDDTT